MREPASVVARSVPLPARVVPPAPMAGVGPAYGSRPTGGSHRGRGTTVAGRPKYIAFRIPEGRGRLTVVAAVQPGARAAFSWALWYSTLAPTGELKKAPVNFIRFRIGARIAKPLIEVIKSGGSLPADLVEQLPIIKL